MKQSKKALTAMLACTLVGAMAIGGTFAYLTDNEAHTNTFTVGKVQIDLTEPNFPGDDPENPPVVPNELVEKDPQITNTGINESYVFMEVKIPVKNVIVADAEGNRKAAADTELFQFGTKGEDGSFVAYDAKGAIGSDWVFLKESNADAIDGVDYKSYVFGYSKKLAKDDKTPALFNAVKFANVIEGQGLEESTLKVPVAAYAIQANAIEGVEATETLDETTLNKVYTVFMNQNSELTTPGEADTNGKLDVKGTEITDPQA